MVFQPLPDPSTCPNQNHDPWTLALSTALISGLIVSYLPQHFRIISTGTSEGLSPWFLLLGATSSASGMINLLIVQWPLFRCCRVVSGGQCAESLLGFVQVFMQWLLFTIIFILYLIYFPHVPHMRFPGQLGYGATRGHPTTDAAEAAAHDKLVAENKVEWRKAVGVAWLTLIHLVVLLILALVLLNTLPTTKPPQPALRRLAQFCGVTGTLLAICQYAPQIYKTFGAGLVGALSIGTMCIQVPGSVMFCISIAVREGTDWTSWMPYAVTGLMQGALLVICLLWKRRQKSLGIDDFGDPLPRPSASDERSALLSS
ncbi:putative protein [Vanrija pseudolonga]|uniref:Purtative protein n=1 Tax=Vanrija pseudolonga TaxID=143232 RepID=A0AAF0YJ62_9TREE|nr:purtative protein [Vanrija pseudolonga]